MTAKELARISKAFADPTRLQIYEAISSRGEMFCGELLKKCPLAPGTISHHLKILAEANLIESRREGQFIYNRARPEVLREYTRALTKLTRKSTSRSEPTVDRIFDLGNSGGANISKDNHFMIAKSLVAVRKRKRR